MSAPVVVRYLAGGARPELGVRVEGGRARAARGAREPKHPHTHKPLAPRPPPHRTPRLSRARPGADLENPPIPPQPILFPKLRIYFADFPYLHYSIRLEAAHLGDLMRLSVRQTWSQRGTRAGSDMWSRVSSRNGWGIVVGGRGMMQLPGVWVVRLMTKSPTHLRHLASWTAAASG